ncbi:uncharacterized protein [Nicotiana tomentosiformis]|uniref:uncharacterized protein n=1 Tax=Nicotiana tomentosiformis TaxID=4098 RepID=UPI00051C3F7A|nr:uncharacterized protein LOC104106168 [Nicotiana tomentosiformis]
MCFTFAWAGWEGATHDSRIFSEALRRSELNFPHPLGNKYYLVDAGYPHMKGYMAPYKGADRDIVIAIMAIHNYIRKKYKLDDAFLTAEDERYIPSVDHDVGTFMGANSANIENVKNQSDNIWMATRDVIADYIWQYAERL